MTSIGEKHLIHGGRQLRTAGLPRRPVVRALLLMTLTALGFASGVGSGASVAAAQAGGLSAELVVVLGKSTPGPSDPKLAAYPTLAGPQFAMFQSRSLLQQVRLTLMPGTPAESKLPNGGKVSLTIKERLPNGAVRLLVEVTKSDGKTRLAKLTAKLAPGVPFFIAGQQHAGGTLIMGVTLKKSGS